MDTASPPEPSNDARSTARSKSPILRQRPLGRAATFAPGLDSPSHPMLRRRSSVITDSSIDDGRSVKSSNTDTFFLPRATGDDNDFRQERTHWESLPLLFAIVPAIGGVFFKNGSALVTDFSLLALAAIYLNWCLRSPWDWYHSAQTVKTEESSHLDTIVEEEVEGEVQAEDAESLEAKSEAENVKQTMVNGNKPNKATDAEAAARELRIHELFALATCFVGPLFGAYTLHVVRSKLSTHLVGEGLVTNIHLTLFVLCAEIRPSRYLIKMIQNRTLHLQRLVRNASLPTDPIDKATIVALGNRVDEIEAAIADSAFRDVSTDTRTTENAEMMKKVQGGLQAQIDPLNRAVRRYEKRTTAQAIQLEARLQSLESRLKEALSLAAVAANYSQRPSSMMPALGSISSLFALPLRVALAAIAFPFTLVNAAMDQVLIRLGIKLSTTKPKLAGTTKSTRTSIRQTNGAERVSLKTSKR